MLCGGICLCAGQKAVIFKRIMVYSVLHSEEYKVLDLLDCNPDFTEIRRRHLLTGIECVINLIGQHTTYIHRGDISRYREVSSKAEIDPKLLCFSGFTVDDGIYNVASAMAQCRFLVCGGEKGFHIG